MIREPLSVLLVGLTDDEVSAIAEDDGFVVVRAPDISSAAPDPTTDAVVLALDGSGPLEALKGRAGWRRRPPSSS